MNPAVSGHQTPEQPTYKKKNLVLQPQFSHQENDTQSPFTSAVRRAERNAYGSPTTPRLFKGVSLAKSAFASSGSNFSFGGESSVAAMVSASVGSNVGGKEGGEAKEPKSEHDSLFFGRVPSDPSNDRHFPFGRLWCGTCISPHPRRTLSCCSPFHFRPPTPITGSVLCTYGCAATVWLRESLSTQGR